MRVLLVNDLEPASGSGAEVHLERLARGLTDVGDDVELFAGAVKHRGPGRALDLWDPLARTRLRTLAARFRPDVVHYHNVLRELSASVFGAVHDAAEVLTVHDLRLVGIPDGPIDAPFDPWPLRQVKLIKAALDRRMALRHVGAVIAPSQALAGMLERSGFTSVHLVPHFLDPGPDPATRPSSSRRIGFAGRLSIEKGADHLIDAFAAATKDDPEARLVLAGEGPQLEALRARADRAARGRVEFLGLVKAAGIRDVFASCRAVAAPSLTREASGLTVLEAAMAGRPVVVSDEPALRELVDEAGCGIVVRRGDSEALAEALRRLLDEADTADRMGSAGRRVASTTRSTEAGIAKTRQVYRSTVIGRR